METRQILYPNVTQVPASQGVDRGSKAERSKAPGEKTEFDAVLEKASELEKAGTGVKFSAHASQRLKDRKITLDQGMMSKVNDALNKAQGKGLEDALILTKDAALIVNVPNRTVVTAMDRMSLAGNVFTNIDGAIVL